MKGHSVHLNRPNLHIPVGEAVVSLVTFGAIIGVVLLGVSVLQSGLVAPSIQADSGTSRAAIQATTYDVQLIADHASKLSLNAAQRREINGVHASWLKEKRRIEREMAIAASAAQERMKSSRGESGVSLKALVSGSKSYMELEEEYCAQRLDHWRHANSYLTPFQRGKLQDELARYR